MMSDQHATKSHVVPKQEPHLFKLPQELLDRIYEYALISEASLDVETYAPRMPGLSQVCRRLRNEFRPKYFKLTRFNIIVTVNNTNEVRRWAAAITDEELRSIPSLRFQLRIKHGRLTRAMVDRQHKAIVDFDEMVGRLRQRCDPGKITVVRDRAFAPYFSEGHVWN